MYSHKSRKLHVDTSLEAWPLFARQLFSSKTRESHIRHSKTGTHRISGANTAQHTMAGRRTPESTTIQVAVTYVHEKQEIDTGREGKRRGRGARAQLRATPLGGSRSSSAARPAARSSPIEQLSGALWSGPFPGPRTPLPPRAHIPFRLLADRGKTACAPCQLSLDIRRSATTDAWRCVGQHKGLPRFYIVTLRPIKTGPTHKITYASRR